MGENMQESFVGQWFDAQKKFIEYWQTNNLSKSYIEMYNSWYESVSDIYKKNYIKFVEKNDYFDIYNTLLTREKAYDNIKNFYESILQNITYKDTNTESLKMFQENAEEYIKYLSNNFVPHLPKPIQDIFSEALQIQRIILKGTEEFCQSLYNNTKDLQGVLFKSMMGDREAVFKYINRWNENYKKSLKRLMDLPKFMENNNAYEMQVEGMSNYINYYNSLVEFNEKILKVGYDSIESTIKKYEDILKNGIKPNSFDEFYSHWFKQNEMAYKELFNSREFIELVDQVTDAIDAFKTNYENVINFQLEMQPFATKKDLEKLKTSTKRK